MNETKIYIILLVILPIIFGIILGGLAYNFSTKTKIIDVPINQEIIEEKEHEPKHEVQSNRKLNIVVDSTLRINQSEKCISNLTHNFCEELSGTKINVPFEYSKDMKYQVIFKDKEAYIINENKNSNPVISYSFITPIS
jgi:hypothetical protein